MKVVTPKEMSRIEALAYTAGESEENFMEQAGMSIAAHVHTFCTRKRIGERILLLCGKGNNGGDAYVAGIYLLRMGYEVKALQIEKLNNCSPLCQKNSKRFQEVGGDIVEYSNTIDSLFFSSFYLLIDGLFGTGFKGKAEGAFSKTIQYANESKKPIIAIDIPSGLNGETGAVEGMAISATETVFLGLPKAGFFLNDGWNFVGKLRYGDFSLPQKFIDEAHAEFLMATEDELKVLFPPIVRSRHKYQRGHVVGLAGSPGMPGAALLASFAALSSGAGIVRLLHPEGMQAELASSPYELIKVPYNAHETKSIIELLNKATATFIGPGIGKEPQTFKLLENVLPRLEKPCVIDADALNILAEREIPLPKQTIFTPHLGELLRLMHREGSQKINLDFLKECQQFAEDKKVTLILKGAPTFIFHSSSIPTVSIYGDPGMATAGSGDVLTGLLASLVSQGLSLENASKLGVYIHGVSGEYAAEELTSSCMIASDIIHKFPRVFKRNSQ